MVLRPEGIVSDFRAADAAKAPIPKPVAPATSKAPSGQFLDHQGNPNKDGEHYNRDQKRLDQPEKPEFNLLEEDMNAIRKDGEFFKTEGQEFKRIEEQQAAFAEQRAKDEAQWLSNGGRNAQLAVGDPEAELAAAKSRLDALEQEGASAQAIAKAKEDVADAEVAFANARDTQQREKEAYQAAQTRIHAQNMKHHELMELGPKVLDKLRLQLSARHKEQQLKEYFKSHPLNVDLFNSRTIQAQA